MTVGNIPGFPPSAYLYARYISKLFPSVFQLWYTAIRGSRKNSLRIMFSVSSSPWLRGSSKMTFQIDWRGFVPFCIIVDHFPGIPWTAAETFVVDNRYWLISGWFSGIFLRVFRVRVLFHRFPLFNGGFGRFYFRYNRVDSKFFEKLSVPLDILFPDKLVVRQLRLAIITRTESTTYPWVAGNLKGWRWWCRLRYCCNSY